VTALIASLASQLANPSIERRTVRQLFVLWCLATSSAGRLLLIQHNVYLHILSPLLQAKTARPRAHTMFAFKILACLLDRGDSDPYREHAPQPLNMEGRHSMWHARTDGM